MSNITLWDITFEEDGKFYTTKEGFDHSIICNCVDMDDLTLDLSRGSKHYYGILKRLVLNISEHLNTPDEQLEEVIGLSWMQLHDLRIELEDE